MEIKYFYGMNTIEELKQRFKELALKYHPDRKGGCEKVMREINKEYDYLKSRINSTSDTENVRDEFREIIMKIINIPGIEIEICGTWIWIHGNTYPNKKKLRKAGCQYASKKKKWFWKPAGARSRGRGKYSMDQIRELHGSQKIKKKEDRILIKG